MLNKICKEIQENYLDESIIYKPTQEQIAFLEKKIMSPEIMEKDEYRLYYRILKAEEAVLEERWEEINQFVFSDVESGAMILRICKSVMPKSFLYETAVSLYTDKGDMFDEVLKIMETAKEFHPDNWNKEMPECVKDLSSFTVYRAGAENIDITAASLSWTLWRDVAEWFAERHEHYGQGEQHLYKAIKRLFPMMTSLRLPMTETNLKSYSIAVLKTSKKYRAKVYQKHIRHCPKHLMI